MRNYKILLITFILSLSTTAFAQTQHEFKDNIKSSVVNPDRFSLLLSDVLVRRLSLEYEHIFANGNMALNIPFSISLSPFEDIWSDQVHWWLGAGLKFYPTGQGVVRYFLGPEFRIISATQITYDWYYDLDNNYRSSNTSQKYVHTAFLINNGIIYSPTDQFFVSLSMGLGFLSRSPEGERDVLVPMATPSFRMGFKF